MLRVFKKVLQLFNPTSQMLTRQDLAYRLRISPRTVKRYMSAAEIKPVGMRGNKNLYGKREVAKFLDFYYNAPKTMSLYSNKK